MNVFRKRLRRDTTTPVTVVSEKEKEATMAQKVHIILTDDLDGSEAVETVSYALDGQAYEVDLNEEHASALREFLAPYLGASRRVSKVKRAAQGHRPDAAGNAGPSAREVRTWAHENGVDCPTTGRVPQSVYDAYSEAQKAPEKTKKAS